MQISAHQPQAVLFDRDGTLLVDVPYNGDPDAVELMPGALEAVARLRTRGLRVGMITNQSGVARGLITQAQVEAVNDRVEQMLGGFEVVLTCPHGPEQRCPWRKPAPGMVLDACRFLGVAPQRTVVIGDIGSDMVAALAAGAAGLMVPTRVTDPIEFGYADQLALTLHDAVEFVLGEAGRTAGIPR